MKKGLFFRIIVIIFAASIIGTNLYCQSWGISLGASTKEVIFGDVFFKHGKNYYHLGYSSQISDAKGEEKYERKSHYGLTTDGTGEKFYTVDVAFGYQIYYPVVVFAELSMGKKKYYTNYIDNRFNDGGYHLITDDESISGFGAGAGYYVGKSFLLFMSYNSIRKVGVGARLVFSMY